MATAEDWISAADQSARPAAPGADDRDESPILPRVVLPLPHAAEWSLAHPVPAAGALLDLGDKDCGDGPLEAVSGALRLVPSGTSLEVHTTDGDVAVALLVWCRLTGHNLVEQGAGRFLVAPASPRAP